METKFNLLAKSDGKVSDMFNGHANIPAGFWRVRRVDRLVKIQPL